MLVVAKDLQTQYEKALDSASISRELRPQFRKWLRFYLDFCSKYGHSPDSKSSLPLFMAKLASKNQPEAKRSEASVAVTLYFKMADTGKANALSKSKSEADRACSKGAESAGASPVTAIREAQGDHPAWEDRRLTNSPEDLRIREPGESMPLSRERIPVAAPIEDRGSSCLRRGLPVLGNLEREVVVPLVLIRLALLDGIGNRLQLFFSCHPPTYERGQPILRQINRRGLRRKGP
jgi:hypothetical protein